jgi:hypothetical protein
MRGGTAAESKAPYYALKTPPLRESDDVDLLAFEEAFDGEHFTHLGIGFSGKANFAKTARGIHPGSLEVSALCITQPTGFASAESDLDCVVAIGFFRLHLGDATGSSFDDGHRNQGIVPIVYLRHAELFAYEGVKHDFKCREMRILASFDLALL